MDTHSQDPHATYVTTSTYSKATTPRDLIWRRGNAKLRKNTIHLSVPAGHTCKPWATKCFTFADKETGKITDGKHQEFRCYAASMESRYPAHRKSLWNNYHILNEHKHDPEEVYKTLLSSVLPYIHEHQKEYEQDPKIRIFGTSGDFWHENIYKGCLALASALNPIRVYWYTKSIPFIIKYQNIEPPNLEQNASIGGRYDHFIELFGLKSAKVVHSYEEAYNLGLPIDQRDELASEAGGSFAILLHGTQPKGSNAAKALQQLKKKGFHGYSKRKAS
jgi:hypothetical protein